MDFIQAVAVTMAQMRFTHGGEQEMAVQDYPGFSITTRFMRWGETVRLVVLVKQVDGRDAGIIKLLARRRLHLRGQRNRLISGRFHLADPSLTPAGEFEPTAYTRFDLTVGPMWIRPDLRRACPFNPRLRLELPHSAAQIPVDVKSA